MNIKQNISLSQYSSYKIGGPAKYFAEVSSKEELIGVLRWWNSKINSKIKPEEKVAKLFHLSGGEAGEARIFVLGGGTNVLIDDKGYDGLVILNKIKFMENGKWKMLAPRNLGEAGENGKLHVGSGILMEDLLKFCIENSLSGLSWAGGLPGTIGGAVRGNAGAFGGEIKGSIFQVESFDTKTLEIKKRNNSECNFGYRSSVFKTNPNEIIIEVVLNLKKGNKEEIENQTNEKIDYRKRKHPSVSKEPNAGSIFKNIPAEGLPMEVAEEFKDKIKTDPFPVLPAGKLIAGAGLTGKRVGDITVSQMHPNFLVNAGHGKSSDVLSLINKIKTAVKKKYGIVLDEEITIIPFLNHKSKITNNK